MHHAFGAAITFRSKMSDFYGQYGNALLSRYPIVFQTNYLLYFFRGIFEDRALLEADVQIQDQTLKIYVTHLSLSPLRQNKQIEYMLEKTEGDRAAGHCLRGFQYETGNEAMEKNNEHSY